ncbi:Solute carrier family 2 facilitated glucose transporter member 1, partial [Dissostichus eleginoides]
YIKDFYNKTALSRNGTGLSGETLTLMYSLTVSVFAIGGLLGSVVVGMLVSRFGSRAAGAGVRARCGAAAGCFVHGRAAGAGVRARCVAAAGCFVHGWAAGDRARGETAGGGTAGQSVRGGANGFTRRKHTGSRKNEEVSKGSVAQKGKVSKTESLCSSSQPEGVTEDSEDSDSESFFDIVE